MQKIFAISSPLKVLFGCLTIFLFAISLISYSKYNANQKGKDIQLSMTSDSFPGKNAGDSCEIAGKHLCWCPAGTFKMGSPPTEPKRRPDEDQVIVTLTSGFWIGKYEITQVEWKNILKKLPEELTAAGGEGDRLPLYNVNYPEAEAFCKKLTELGIRSRKLPPGWEFELPTEAQWEYACRAGTTTVTAFGNKISSRQANFNGKPYNGADQGPNLQ